LETAIHQFARLLRPGGALVCDERNFDYIIQNWDEISRDAWNNFRFNKRAAENRVMYYGDSVLGAPVKWSPELGRVIFEYAKVARGEDGHIAPIKDGTLGTLSMFPFKKGAMLKAIRDEPSFGTVDIYSDLEKSGDLDPTADFYTYVAHRQ
jgi:hypothetical protein